MKINLAVYLLVCALLLIVYVEAKSSPCPSVFSYDEQEDTSDTWYGTLRLKTSVALHGIFIDVIFDGQVFVFGAYFKDVTTKDNLHFHIEDKTYRLNTGETLILKFYVKYHEHGTVPMLRQIRFNGQNICVDESNRATISEKPTVIKSFEKPVTLQEVGNQSKLESNLGNHHSFQTVQPINSGTPQRDSALSSRNHPTSSTTSASLKSSTLRLEPVYQNVKSFTNAPAIESSFVQTTPSERTDQHRRTQESAHPTKLYDPIQDPTIWKKPTGGSTERTTPATHKDHLYVGGLRNTGSVLMGRISTDPPTVQVDRSSGAAEISGFFESDYHHQQTRTTTTRKPTFFQGDYAFIKNPETTTHYINSFDDDICGTIVPKANPLVTHGNTAQASQFPWHGALYRSTVTELKYLCGATVVSKRIAITAAHCVAHDKSSDPIDPGSLLLYLGKTNLKKWTGPEQDAKIDRIHIHPDYNYRRFFADIAVLRLRNDVKFTHFIRPACLWNFDEDYKVLINKVGFVPGWGYNEQGLVSEELSYAQMPVVAHETCIWSNRDFFSKVTSNTSFCAGFRNGTSVCNGDSGGGMVFKQNNHWYLRGIVSVSAALQNNVSCDTNHYAVFTDVAKFLQWIQSFM
ncbi:uncharacterized protein LOC129751283 [Uranotaenia lowii]|uniref:uncharacterized protein LOC129751283 n=1 Tax=Uranotaenia lowii TaxID=190385 RepID=UPI002478AD50|nr:uncharacterized protein LOC129751283 [Uranotaenia lowii]